MPQDPSSLNISLHAMTPPLTYKTLQLLVHIIILLKRMFHYTGSGIIQSKQDEHQ